MEKEQEIIKDMDYIEQEIIKDMDYIEVMLKEGNIEVKIKYPKHSQLKKRFDMLEKLKETLRRI